MSYWHPTIEYPIRFSEFEIQATVYWGLRSDGIDVRGCVPSRAFESGTQLSRSGRIKNKHPKVFFDLVVFSSHQTPIVIVECKNRTPDSPLRQLGGRQQRRYETFNIPIILCDRESEITTTVEKVKAMVEEFEGAFA